MTSSGTTAESARSIACQIDGIDTCILNMLEKDGRAEPHPDYWTEEIRIR